MGEIFTPYTIRGERTAEPRALSALKRVRGLEELLLGWVVQNRTLSLSPVGSRIPTSKIISADNPRPSNKLSGSTDGRGEARQSVRPLRPAFNQNQSRVKVDALDVQFSRSGRRIGAGVLHLDYILSFLPPVCSVREAIDSSGSPSEGWFEARNSALGIELDTEYDLNRCPARTLSQLILSYLLNHDAMCTVRSTGTLKNPQLCIELVYLSPQFGSDMGNSLDERLGWKEVCLVHRGALQSFVPHVYWV